jgi:hypothetical protein
MVVQNALDHGIAPLLALLGGAVIIAGCLLTWVDAGGGVSVGTVLVTGTPNATDLRLGQVALGAGVASIVLGAYLLVVRRGRKFFSLLVLLAGLGAIATAAYVAMSLHDRYVDFAAETGAPAGETDEVRASVSRLFEVSNLKADPGIGLYVVIGGGAASVIAGIGGLFGRRKSAEPEARVAVLEPIGQAKDEDHEVERLTASEIEQPSVESNPEPEFQTRAGTDEDLGETAPSEAEEPPGKSRLAT